MSSRATLSVCSCVDSRRCPYPFPFAFLSGNSPRQPFIIDCSKTAFGSSPASRYFVRAEIRSFDACGVIFFRDCAKACQASRGNQSGSAAGATASFFFSVSVFCTLSSERVSGTSDETFRWRSRNARTLSVETSDLNCLAFQLCGRNPVSVSSKSSRRTISSMTIASLTTVVRMMIAASSKSLAISPPYRLAMQSRNVHARYCLSESLSTFGSSGTAS